MSGWGFWEWLTYVCIGVAALMLALDAAVKQSPDLNARYGGLLAGRAWAFMPFVLILVSAVVIATKQLTLSAATPATVRIPASPSPGLPAKSVAPPVVAVTPQRPKTFHLEAPTVAPVPSNLKDLSNEDLRVLAYTVSGQSDELTSDYFQQLGQAKWDDSGNKIRSPELYAQVQLQLDAEFNRIFRAQLKLSVMRLELELFRRTKARYNPVVFGDKGLIDTTDADSAASLVRTLAQQLP